MKKDLYAFTRGLRSWMTMTTVADKWCSHECKLTLQLDNLVAAGVTSGDRGRKQFFARPVTKNTVDRIPNDTAGLRKLKLLADSQKTALEDKTKMFNLAKNILKAAN